MVFQWTGVTFFLISFFICCSSALISRDHATRERPSQPAIAVALPCAVFFGMALAAVGLGLQAQSRRAAPVGVVLTGVATLFWLIEAIWFASMGAIGMMLVCLLLAIGFGGLLMLAVAAFRDMRANPPPVGLEVLPQDYKVPYSHMHHEPPEVRLARELEQRRERLAVQQKELELLEHKLKRKLQQKDE